MVQPKISAQTLPVHERMPFWLLLLGILVGGGILLFILGWFFPGLDGQNQFPYAIHSPLVADYSGERPASFAPVNFDAVVQLLYGQSEQGQKSQQAVIEQLKTPVPTVTPQPGQSGSVVLPEATATATAKVDQPTASAMPTNSPTISSPTPTLESTPTSVTPTRAPTSTRAANTPVPTAAQPTDPPAQPTDPPAQPTDPPAQPTDPPVQPTDPPVPPDYPPPAPVQTGYPSP